MYVKSKHFSLIASKNYIPANFLWANGVLNLPCRIWVSVVPSVYHRTEVLLGSREISAGQTGKQKLDFEGNKVANVKLNK